MIRALSFHFGIAWTCGVLALSFCGCSQERITTDPKTEDFTPEYVAKCKKRAERGDATFQEIYGRALHDGLGIASKQEESVVWLGKAAEQGNARSMWALGVCYAFGTGVKKDMSKAAEWYRKAAEQGDARGMRALGVCYERGNGVEKSEARAVEWYSRAAEQGAATGQIYLGLCYENGVGVEKDATKAAEWYRRAAEQGDAWGQRNIGWCYASGTGVEKDETKAVEWYTKSANQGNAVAERLLSFCYAEGRGVGKDESKAVELMRHSAEHGDSRAQFVLGRWHEYGLVGIKRDTKSAIKLYLKAVGNGCSSAELYYKLGNLFWNGAPSSDFKRDEGKAIDYWTKAAEGGNKEAKKLCAAMETNPGWSVPFDQSSLTPNTKIDSFAGFSFGEGGMSEDQAKRMGLKMSEDWHLVKEGAVRKTPFRKMDYMDFFFTPKTRELYGMRLYVRWGYSTFDSVEAAFVESIATRETVTRHYGVLPLLQCEDGKAEAQNVFVFPNNFKYVYKLDGTTLTLAYSGRDISLTATDDELAEIAENERQTLLKKAKETAAENDGGDIL